MTNERLAVETYEYEIGGVQVIMTREQADRWNAAEITEQDQDTIMVTLPYQYVLETSIRNGLLAIGDAKLVEHSRQITLREAYDQAELVERFDNCAAVKVA